MNWQESCDTHKESHASARKPAAGSMPESLPAHPPSRLLRTALTLTLAATLAFGVLSWKRGEDSRKAITDQVNRLETALSEIRKRMDALESSVGAGSPHNNLASLTARMAEMEEALERQRLAPLLRDPKALRLAVIDHKRNKRVEGDKGKAGTESPRAPASLRGTTATRTASASPAPSRRSAGGSKTAGGDASTASSTIVTKYIAPIPSVPKAEADDTPIAPSKGSTGPKAVSEKEPAAIAAKPPAPVPEATAQARKGEKPSAGNNGKAIVAALAPKPEKAKKSLKGRKPRYHNVRSGDTLYKISRRYGVSVKALKKMNRLKSGKILIGQQLKVGHIVVN